MMDYAPLVAAAAKQYGVPVPLAMNVLNAESGGNPNAVSPAGAQGLMQLMPATAKSLGVANPFNPAQNINGGVQYLAQMLHQFGNPQAALAAYNWGPGNVAKYGAQAAPPETKAYVAKVTGQSMNPFESTLMQAAKEAEGSPQPTATQAAAPQAASDPFESTLMKAAQEAEGPQTAPQASQPVASSQLSNGTVLPSSNAPINVGQRVAQGLWDPMNAAQQLVQHALPQGFVQGVNGAMTAIDKVPYLGPAAKFIGLAPGMTDADIQKIGQNYNARMQHAGNTGVDWPRVLASGAEQSLGTLAMPEMSALKGAAALGGISGALTPVENGGQNYASDVGQNVLTGAAGGALMGGASKLAGAVLSPVVKGAQRALLDAGVPLTPGQIFGGAAKRLEDAGTSIPFVGDMIRNAQRRAAVGLNQAAVNRALSPIGEKLPSGLTGHDAIDFAQNKLGDAYNDVVSKIGAVRPDQQMYSDLGTLGSMVNGLPEATAKQFQNIIDREITGRVDPNGFMTGQGLKAAESNLGRIARGNLRSGDYNNQELGRAVSAAQGSLRQMLARVSPENAADLSNINSGWANLMRPERASSSLGAENGVFSPAQLNSAVKSLATTKGQFAGGNALMQDLSRPAVEVMGSKVPDSGTPLRHAVQLGAAALLGHEALPAWATEMMPPLAIGGGLLSLPYTETGGNIIRGLLAGARPQAAKAIGHAVGAYGPRVLAPVAAQGLLGLAASPG